MKMSNLSAKLSKMTGRTGLVLKKYSPEILLVVGITGAVASTVLACRATLRAEEVLENHKKKISSVKSAREEVKNGHVKEKDYPETAYKKDLTVVYTQTTVDFLKLYGPALSLGLFSYACIIGGHGIMRKRNVAIVAAYKVLEEGFNNYRQRVKEEYGEDTDYMFKNNLRAETVTDTEVGEDGKSKKVKKTVVVDNADTNGYSQYARFYDDGCKQWSKDPEYNLMYLKSQQNWYNNILQNRGHVFLNEVYDALGIERTKEGSVVGWVLGSDGDQFIDFGIFDGEKPRARAFVNGRERTILLDFNVNGVIWDKI